jgi:mannan endo-1,4-beta-mannosidase
MPLRAKTIILLAALTLIVGAAFFVFHGWSGRWYPATRLGFVERLGIHFVINGKPFRFVGANVPIIPGHMTEISRTGIKVVRIWALGEGVPRDRDRLPDPPGTPATYPYRWSPDNWNEEALRQLDRIIAEAGQHGIRVQICLTNWWRDTGGVTQYLRWAGIEGADDDSYPYGINFEKAMLFYTNEDTRRMYRQHVEKIATRRNHVTGILYRDDPSIFGWELMNEAQAVTGRWNERREWIREMSSYLKSLDPNHLISPGDWGFRSTVERREWIADHNLPNVDYCDVHIYAIDDKDSFVSSPSDLREFIDNRGNAALVVNKPLVFGEFGMQPEGYGGFSQRDWFRNFFEENVRVGAGGAMFWILTPDAKRRYSVAFSERDQTVLQEISRAAWLFDTYKDADPPSSLEDSSRYLVPHQEVLKRSSTDPTVPNQVLREDKSILYRFKGEMATSGRFEKLGSGPNYIWGSGVGFFEYVVPKRSDRRRVSQVIVRARIQPVVPTDARPEDIKTRVTLVVNGNRCDSRLVPVEDPKQPLTQEWRVNNFIVRLSAMRGLPLTIRFEVTADADWPYGLNISTWPAGFDSGERTPVEVEVRR